MEETMNASAEELVEWAYHLEALGGMLSDMVYSDIRVEDFRWNIGRLGMIIRDYSSELRFNLDEAYAGGGLKDVCDSGGDSMLNRLKGLISALEESKLLITADPDEHQKNVDRAQASIEAIEEVECGEWRQILELQKWFEEAKRINLQRLAEGPKEAHAASGAA